MNMISQLFLFFTYKNNDNKSHVGTIAQYWQNVLPEVHWRGHRYRTTYR